MTADDFLAHPVYGRDPIQDIDSIFDRWSSDARGLPADDHVGMATMLAVLGIDASLGDGLLNQISPQVQDAMQHLMGDKAATYNDSRASLTEHYDRGTHSFDGFVSKVKGQIGEDRFVTEHSDFVLAASRNQEAIDAIKILPDGTIEAAQVKLYGNADAVISAMKEVQQKVAAGFYYEGHKVSRLSFVVPDNIADAVQEKMKLYPELNSVTVQSVHLSAADAADLIRDSADHVIHPLKHLTFDVAESVAYSTLCDLMINAYFLVSGKSSIADVVQKSATKTPLTAAAVTTSKSIALALSKAGVCSNPIAIPLIAAVATRKVASQWYDSRSKYASSLRDQCNWLQLLETALQSKGRESNCNEFPMVIA